MADRISVAACESIIDRVASHCAAATAPVEHTSQSVSSGDGLAAVAAAIAVATAVLGIITIAAAIGWLFYVRHRTKIEAKSEVEKVAPAEVRAYLDAKVPEMVAEIVAQLSGQTEANSKGGLSPDEQAEALSEDPR